MLIIRQEQMDALSQSRVMDFEERAVFSLTRISDKLCKIYDNKKLKDFVHESVLEAKDLRIVAECDVIRYLKLKYQIGTENWNTQDFKWIHRYLIRQLPAWKRLDLIIEHLRFSEELDVTL